MDQRRYLLSENDIPTRWYNIAPDLPSAPPPPLHPGTRQPVGPDDLAPLFPMEIIRQEVSQEREVPIPDEVRALYSMWRPTPLVRALGLEQALGTRSRIFYKYEGVSPGGIAQAEHRGPAGLVRQARRACGGSRPRPVRASGARRWSFAGALLGLEIKVYMVRTSYDSKPYRPVADRALGRPGRARARRRRRTRDGRSWPRTPNRPERSGSRSPRRSRTPRRATTRSTRWGRCSTTS